MKDIPKPVLIAAAIIAGLIVLALVGYSLDLWETP